MDLQYLCEKYKLNDTEKSILDYLRRNISDLKKSVSVRLQKIIILPQQQFINYAKSWILKDIQIWYITFHILIKLMILKLI